MVITYYPLHTAQIDEGSAPPGTSLKQGWLGLENPEPCTCVVVGVMTPSANIIIGCVAGILVFLNALNVAWEVTYQSIR